MIASSKAIRSLRRHRGLVGGALAAVLVAGLVQPLPASAAPVRRKAPKTQKMASVPGRDAVVSRPPVPDQAAAGARRATPRSVWPAAGSATVELAAPTPGSTKARSSARGVRAGTLPVRVGQPRPVDARPAKTRGAARRVTVTVLDRTAAQRAGVDGLLIQVARADGGRTPAAVSVEVDYAAFAHAYGGDWASRLRLVQLPECALAARPVASCPAATPVVTRNDVRAKHLTAVVSATPDAATAPAAGLLTTSRRQRSVSSQSTTTFAVTAGAYGGAGDYRATPLAPSSSWQVSAHTGDFTWSYPFRVPPATGGTAPQLAISYSSGSVDGRVSSQNSQPSWIGEGHSLESGFVERKYIPCADDRKTDPKYPAAVANNKDLNTGDQCWKTDNATLSLAGHSSELLKLADGSWVLENDDKSKIERFTGEANLDNNGEYWKLTTTDGTQYFFGLAKRYPTDTVNTNSTWTTPVFGNNPEKKSDGNPTIPADPCYTSTYRTAHCIQAWRWNLAYVVDPHNNTMSYFYTKETNSYGRNNNEIAATYDRGGYLSRIEYGEQRGTEHSTLAPAQVVFTVEERCLKVTGGFQCTEAEFTAANAWRWPDVPFDRVCKPSGTPLRCGATQLAPTYFTRKRLVNVKMQVKATPAAITHTNVEMWALTQSFPDPGDGTSKGLWLSSVLHTGLVGGSLALPRVTFHGVQMSNRVDGLDIAPPMVKYRISSITSETGGVTAVTYTDRECVPGSNMPVSPAANTKRCYPVYWAAEGQLDPKLNYFHKYLATKVLEHDATGGALPVETVYEYLGTPAYHYDDNEFGKPDYRTYSDWRGYGVVRVKTGTGAEQTMTEHRFLRGMDGDGPPGGPIKDIHVAPSPAAMAAEPTLTAIEDHPRLNGFLREHITYNGPTGDAQFGQVNDPVVTETGRNGDTIAWLLGTRRSMSWTKLLPSGSYRRTESLNTYNGDGFVETVDDRGEIGTDVDDRCTRHTYTPKRDIWLLDAVARTETVSVKCATAPLRPAQVISDVRMYFDNSTVWSTPPVRGDTTATETLRDYVNGNPVYVTKGRMEFDPHGRTVASTDALGKRSTTVYTPTTGGPITQTVTTNPLGHTSTTVVNAAWGSPVSQTDTNNKRTQLGYDPLGRLLSVWLPGQETNMPATLKFAYLIRNDGPVVITTQELRNNGTYTTKYALFDALLRPRQTQAPAAGAAGGRVLTDTIYGSRGQAKEQNGPYYNTLAPSTALFTGVPDNAMPAKQTSTFDGVGRPAASAFLVNGTEKWRTTTTYGGDRVHVDPPEGSTPTTVITDGRGRTTALRQYRGSTPTGTYDETTYAYNSDGQQSQVTDPAGNSWTYAYDTRGRKIESVDPDSGTTRTDYDDQDQVTKTTDGRGRTLTFGYDDLGRKVEVREQTSPTTSVKLTSWAYDPPGATGKPASASRWVGESEYRTSVTGYDNQYRPTGSTITIPAVEAELAGDYTTALTYNPDGGIRTMRLPDLTGLPSEEMRIAYDTLGLPVATSGWGSYVAGTRYSPFGEVLRLDLGNEDGKANWQSSFYEEGTRRLQRFAVDRENVTGSDADITYSYDATGNIKSIVDAPPGQPSALDRQCFDYDYLRRLTEAWTASDCAAARSPGLLTGPAPYWHSYGYDLTGNRTSEVQHSTAGDTSRTYSYPPSGPAPAQPHTLRGVATAGPGGDRQDSYSYDAAGNLQTRNLAGSQDTLAWDAEGHLASVSGPGGSTSFLYDANGARLIRHEPTGTTLYIDGAEIRLDRVTRAKTSTRYYMHAGRTVAVRTAAGVQSLASDHHGTAELSIHNGTTAVTRRRFTPFGAPRGTDPTTWPGQRGFVGGTKDATTGLTHLGAREYDPSTGRFISVDPIIDLGDPQQMNGYAYSNNNPTSFSDADGLQLLETGGASSASSASTASEPQTERAATHHAQERRKHNATPQGKREQAERNVAAARAKREAAKQKLIAVAKELGKVLASEIGVVVAFDCLATGDSCGEMALNIGLAVVGAAAGKLAMKYGPPWKWRAGGKLLTRLQNLVGEMIDGAKAFFRHGDEAASAEKRLDNVLSCPNSFIPGTGVLLADGTRRPIEELKLGDQVLATDPETGQTGARPVVRTLTSKGTKHLVRITVDTDSDDGDVTATVVATGNHPFWVDDRGRWVDAADLQPGDELLTPAGDTLAVVGTAHGTAIQRVHNLTIDGIHTYYVNALGGDVLVHNCPSGGVPKTPTGRGSVPPDQRDPQRLFTRAQVQEGLEEQGGVCAQCGNPLELKDAKGHHRKRHADGARTVPEERVVLCSTCHVDVHRK